MSDVASLAFSPDDERLASGSLEAPYLIVWDKAGNRRDVAGPERQVERVAWSADGRFLASAAGDNVVYVWDGTSLEVVRRVNLRGFFNSGTALAWSRDGTRLAAGDGSGVQIINPDSDTPVGTLDEGASGTGTTDTVEIAGWSTDGTRLGTFSKYNRTSSVWDVGRPLRLQTFRVGLWKLLTE
jgi:WD40 repeat protein